MKKQTAIDLLGGTPRKAQRALGYKSIQAIYVWPDPLPQATADRVNGAVARLSKKPRGKALAGQVAA